MKRISNRNKSILMSRCVADRCRVIDFGSGCFDSGLDYSGCSGSGFYAGFADLNFDSGFDSALDFGSDCYFLLCFGSDSGFAGSDSGLGSDLADCGFDSADRGSDSDFCSDSGFAPHRPVAGCRDYLSSFSSFCFSTYRETSHPFVPGRCSVFE